MKCNPSDPERLERVLAMTDQELLDYAEKHISLDSCDLITALVLLVQGLKQEIENWRGNG